MSSRQLYTFTQWSERGIIKAVMIYTKPIEQITYQDILEFCAEDHRESIHLDYKRDIDRSLVKTIAAMANTWGGVIVIGVDEEDSKPKMPVVGLPYDEHLRERINNLILGNVMPPVFPEIQVCTTSDGAMALVLVRLSQSNLTPHAIRGNTQVYVRTDTSNEPEELATIERVLWLVERRKRSEELKSSFFLKAEDRFNTLCGRNGVVIPHTDGVFAVVPTFPFEMLRKPKELRDVALAAMAVRGLGGNEFPVLRHRTQYEAIQEGTYGFIVNEQTGYVCYEELNQYGFFYHREYLGRTDKSQAGKEDHYAFLYSLLGLTDELLESAIKLYSCLGYWGYLDVRVTLKKLNTVRFKDLPAPRGFHKVDEIVGQPVDETVEFKKTLSVGDLAERRLDWVVGLFLEIAWGVGFSHITEVTVRKLLEEGGRATG